MAGAEFVDSCIELEPGQLLQHKSQLMHSLLVAIAISFSDALLKNAVDLYMEHTWGLFSKLCFVEYAGPASKTSSFEKCEEQSRIFGVVHSVILTLLTDLRPQVNRASVKLLKFWFTESIKLLSHY